IFIEGPVGIGKSRLLEQLRIDCALEPYQFITCSFRNIGAHFQPLVLALSRSVNASQLICGAQSLFPSLSQYFDESHVGYHEYSTEKIASDFATLILTVARSRWTILIIEDVDRADAEVFRFIEQLCCRAAETELRLILTSRPNSRASALLTSLHEILGEQF